METDDFVRFALVQESLKDPEGGSSVMFEISNMEIKQPPELWGVSDIQSFEFDPGSTLTQHEPSSPFLHGELQSLGWSPNGYGEDENIWVWTYEGGICHRVSPSHPHPGIMSDLNPARPVFLKIGQVTIAESAILSVMVIEPTVRTPAHVALTTAEICRDDHEGGSYAHTWNLDSPEGRAVLAWFDPVYNQQVIDILDPISNPRIQE